MPDLWVWHFTRNGKHTVRSAYHAVLDSPISPTHHSPIASTSSGHNPIWKRIWKLKLPPRIHHFLWKCCSETLPAAEYLARRGLGDHHLCPLCGMADISTAHLFFLCPFALAVWYLAGLKERVLQFQQPTFSLWLQDLLNLPMNIGEYIATICSMLWFHRNRWVFEGEFSEPHTVVLSSNNILRAFHNSHLWPERLSHSLEQTPLVQKTLSGIKICCDGAISRVHNCAGVGIIILAADGSFVRAYSQRLQGICNPEEAEFLALRQSLILALQMNLIDFCIYNDSASAILAVNNEADCSSNCLPILSDIHRLQSLMSLSGFFWFSRLQNVLAHELAFHAKNMVEQEQSWSSLPPFICQSLLDDFQQI